jgi:hypothetical protein
MQLAFNLTKKCSMLRGTVSEKQQLSPVGLLHAVPLSSFSTCSWRSSFSIRRIFLKGPYPENNQLNPESLLQLLLNFKEKWKSYMMGQCHGKKMLHETLKKQSEKTTRKNK